MLTKYGNSDHKFRSTFKQFSKKTSFKTFSKIEFLIGKGTF